MIGELMKLIAIITIIVTVCIFAYFYMFGGRDSFDPKNLELSHVDLHVKELDVGLKNKVWKIDRANHTVAFSIVFKNEGSRNFKNTPGILDVIEKAIFDGAGEYDATKIAEILIDNNITIQISFNYDNAIVRCYTTSDKFELAIMLLGKILTKAHFNPQKLELYKNELVTNLKQSKFDSDVLATERLYQVLFTKNHPYYSTIDEEIKAIAKYSRFDIEQSYSKLFAPKDAQITVAGNIPDDVVKKSFAILLQTLSCKKNNFEDVSQTNKIELTDVDRHVELAVPQTTVMFVMKSVLRNSSDFFAYKMLELIFGDGSSVFGNRLFGNVREIHGLCYSIYTKIVDHDLIIFTVGTAKTDSANVEKLKTEIQNTVTNLVKHGVNNKELEEMKIMLSSHLACESALDIVTMIEGMRKHCSISELRNYMDKFYSLSVHDINKIIKKVFSEIVVFVDAGQTVKEREQNKRGHNEKQ